MFKMLVLINTVTVPIQNTNIFDNHYRSVRLCTKVARDCECKTTVEF